MTDDAAPSPRTETRLALTELKTRLALLERDVRLLERRIMPLARMANRLRALERMITRQKADS